MYTQRAGQEAGNQVKRERDVWREGAGLPAGSCPLEKSPKMRQVIHPLPLNFSPKDVPSAGPELPDPRGSCTLAATCTLNSAWSRCFQNHCSHTTVSQGPGALHLCIPPSLTATNRPSPWHSKPHPTCPTPHPYSSHPGLPPAAWTDQRLRPLCIFSVPWLDSYC